MKHETVVLLATLLFGCSKASESADSKRFPKPPPSASVAVPDALRIDVEIDGAAAPAIDKAKLEATKPDFSDDDHRAWQIATLVGAAAARPGVVVAAIGDKGLTVEMRASGGEPDAVPVLELNRRGEVVAEMVSPDDPFPEFHGKGGRLSRPGDPLPRVPSPSKIRVYLDAAAVAPAASASSGSVAGNSQGGGEGQGGGARNKKDPDPLEVKMPGGAKGKAWTPQMLDGVARISIHADNADRNAWSLRDVAHKLVGPKARVTSATDGEGTRVKIDAKEWANAKVTPVLRINRRGMYKIEWVDEKGNMTNDDDVRDVRSVEVAP